MEDTFKSTSGAWITELDGYVVKTGQGVVGERIDAQADWLIENAGPNVCPVVAHVPGVLVMPRLQEWDGLDDDPLSARVVHEEVVNALERVWERPALEEMFDEKPKLYQLMRVGTRLGSDVAEYASDLATQIKWDALARCRTHGDPTWCNTLWDANELRLIDPLPATALVPDLLAVDLGKLLQSCLGWERVAHGWNLYEGSDWPEQWVRDLCQDDNEWLAATFWCLVHLARLVPYFKDNEAVTAWVKEVTPRVCGL